MAKKKELTAPPDRGDTPLIGRAGTVLVRTGYPEVDEYASKLWIQKNSKVSDTSFREFSLLFLVSCY